MNASAQMVRKLCKTAGRFKIHRNDAVKQGFTLQVLQYLAAIYQKMVQIVL